MIPRIFFNLLIIFLIILGELFYRGQVLKCFFLLTLTLKAGILCAFYCTIFCVFHLIVWSYDILISCLRQNYITGTTNSQQSNWLRKGFYKRVVRGFYSLYFSDVLLMHFKILNILNKYAKSYHVINILILFIARSHT